jgi:adenine-specific DNA methylase
MMKAKKLIEVALPIKEISLESVRDKSLCHSKGHMSTLHVWWARRPLPTCRAVVFASIVPDPLDELCPVAFGEAIDDLLNKGKAKAIYKPYADIPYTAVLDPVEDNRRNRLLAFIGQFSDKCQQNMLAGKATSPKELLSDYSLIKWECKNNPEILATARKLIWVAYNAEQEPSKSYDALSAEFDVAYKAISDAEKALYGTVDRHIECDANWDLEIALKMAIENFQNRMPSVFDPFAGGGAIPLEAARLGCRSYGNDINPVAHIIEKGSAEFPQKYGKPIVYSKAEFERIYGDDGIKLFQEKNANDGIGWRIDTKNYYLKNRLSFDVEYYAKKILKETEADVGYLYPADEQGRKPVAYYWARTAKCSNPSCGAEVPLLRGFYLCNRDKKKIYLNPVITGNDIQFEIKEGTCKLKEWNRRGVLTCPCCGSVTSVDEVKADMKKQQNPYGRMLAVISDSKDGKEYRIPNEQELRVSRQSFSSEDIQRPSDRMPIENVRNFNTPGFGFSNWGDLFSDRQLYVMNNLVRHFQQVKESVANNEYGHSLVVYLALLIDRIAAFSNSFCVWDSREIIQRIMGRQAVAMVFDYPESNPFSGSTGSAENHLEWIVNFLETEGFCPFSASFHNSSSGEKRQYEAKSIDVTVTDPPYYDAIAYADCSDFFYIWLKRTIGDLYPLNFATPQTPKMEECTALKHHQGGTDEKAKIHFENKLTQIFDAIELQTGDIVSIMFAHQSTEAWTTLCNSILAARMNITGSWAMDTEQNCGMKADKAYLESSVTVSCRPSERKGFGDFAEVKAAIEKKVADEVESLYQLGFRGADLLTACFGQAVSEFGHYKTVEKADGTEVTVGELLELARNAAFNTLLKGVQGDVYTRFYIGWLQMNGAGDADYDDATKFTRVGLPVDIQDVKSKNLLIGDGKNFHLAMAEEHLGDKGAVIGTRPEDSLIEQVHRAMLLYKSEDRALLLALIKNVAQDENGPFWRLLASLKELLPANDDLKQVEGLLQNAADLRESSKEKPREVIGDLFDTAR